MTNTQATTPESIRQQAQAFWQAWDKQAAQLSTLSSVERVEAGNELLHQYIEGVFLEIQEDEPRDLLIFSANGMLDQFIAIDILLQTATTRDYDLIAFRQPIPAEYINEFVMRMDDDIELLATDLLISASATDQLIDLDVTLQKQADEEQLPHLQNMAFIMLDHILGEWDLAVKIRSVEFADTPAENAVRADQLPELINDLWENTLNHDGEYPQAEESEWAAAESEESAEQDALVLIRNESAASLLGRPDMAWCIIIDSELTCKEDLDTAQDLEEHFYNQISKDQHGIGVLSIVNFTQGIRSIHAYCRNPKHGIAAALSAMDAFPQLDSSARSDYDPAWQWYQF
ncbi:hypothetical protein KRX19_10545 [Cardiobacteriaceae bacterium TAE3-ERU3]|nr:hypothetical protein [Cardiobacteriaceae bacterium TAE3-ERU3]